MSRSSPMLSTHRSCCILGWWNNTDHKAKARRSSQQVNCSTIRSRADLSDVLHDFAFVYSPLTTIPTILRYRVSVSESRLHVLFVKWVDLDRIQVTFVESGIVVQSVATLPGNVWNVMKRLYLYRLKMRTCELRIDDEDHSLMTWGALGVPVTPPL